MGTIKISPKIVVIAAVAILSAFGFFGWSYYKNSLGPFPLQIRQSVGFPLYYPAEVPNGFQIDENSFSATNQAVIYNFEYEESKKLIFTLQPRPKDFDIDKFYELWLNDRTEMITPVGKAINGKLNGVAFGSLVTAETWIIVTAPSGINESDLGQILSGIRRYD